MTIHVEAIYKDGVFRPVERVAIYDEERVTLIIEPLDDLDDLIDHEYLAHCRAELAKRDKPAPTAEEIRERLKDVPGSFSDLIIQERGSR